MLNHAIILTETKLNNKLEHQVADCMLHVCSGHYANITTQWSVT